MAERREIEIRIRTQTPDGPEISDEEARKITEKLESEIIDRIDDRAIAPVKVKSVQKTEIKSKVTMP